MRCLTSLSRAPQDFDYCPRSRAPELKFVGRLTALNSVFNIIKVLPNNVDRPVTMSVDEASRGDPGDPVHRERIGVESLRQVKLTTSATPDSDTPIDSAADPSPEGRPPFWLRCSDTSAIISCLRQSEDGAGRGDAAQAVLAQGDQCGGRLPRHRAGDQHAAAERPA